MKTRVVSAAFLAILVLALAALAGCGDNTNTQKGWDENRIYRVNETAALADAATGRVESGQFGSEITVTRVTATNDIASQEANALLLTSEYDHEGDNVSKSPASGMEFLMITFLYRKNGYEPTHNILPSELKLANSKGDSYALVPTQGHGGIYNADPIQPGMQTSVTAVFEVPKNEGSLVLTYEQSGMKPVKFEIP